MDQNENLENIIRQFSDWRSSLPDLLRPEADCHHTGTNLESIMLSITGFRFECMLYHALRRRYAGNDKLKYDYANQQLKTAMLEIDHLIGKAITEGIIRMLPISLLVNPLHDPIARGDTYRKKMKKGLGTDVCS